MSLDDAQAIDAISTDRSGSTVTLTIFDAWDWNAEGRHLAALQDKINAYFWFVESGQIYEVYKGAPGKSLIVELVTSAPIPPACAELLRRADLVAKQLNMMVRHRIQSMSGTNSAP